MSEKEAIEVLIEKGYIIPIKGKYQLTGEFHRNYIPVSTELAVVSREMTVNSKAIVKSENIATVKDLLKKFVKDADIPYRIKTDSGSYTVSAISAEGVKAFGNILKAVDSEGNRLYNYEVLVYSTKLYYKRDSYRKTLTNYLVKGDFEVEYEEFKSKMSQGEIQNHVKKELSAGQSNTELI